jgi:hypothetical protein
MRVTNLSKQPTVMTRRCESGPKQRWPSFVSFRKYTSTRGATGIRPSSHVGRTMLPATGSFEQSPLNSGGFALTPQTRRPACTKPSPASPRIRLAEYSRTPYPSGSSA